MNRKQPPIVGQMQTSYRTFVRTLLDVPHTFASFSVKSTKSAAVLRIH